MKSNLKQYVEETKAKIAEDILRRSKFYSEPREKGLCLRALITGAMFAAASIEPHVDQPDFPIEGTPVFAWLAAVLEQYGEEEMTEMLKAAL